MNEEQPRHSEKPAKGSVKANGSSEKEGLYPSYEKAFIPSEPEGITRDENPDAAGAVRVSDYFMIDFGSIEELPTEEASSGAPRGGKYPWHVRGSMGQLARLVEARRPDEPPANFRPYGKNSVTGGSLDKVLLVWGMLLTWGSSIAFLSVPLSFSTIYWPLILVFGAVLPIAITLGNRFANHPEVKAPPGSESQKERELLEALTRRDELTPVLASLETSLSISEADRMLSKLAQKGYLEVRASAGGLSFALWNQSRQKLQK